MKKVDQEIDDLSLAGSIISAISGMEDITSNTLNIGLESNKYGDVLAKSSFVYKYCINKIGKSRSNKISNKRL